MSWIKSIVEVCEQDCKEKIDFDELSPLICKSNGYIVVEYHYSDNRFEIQNSCEEKSETVIIQRQ